VNFSMLTLMLNVTYFTIAIAALCSDSQFFLALATFLFVILILRSVACCLLATENRAYWLGSGTISCGILLSSPYLLIFDAIASYEDNRRHGNYAFTFVPSPIPQTLLPSSQPTTFVPSVAPITTWSLPPTMPSYTPGSFVWQFPGGFASVLKAFLVTTVAYLAGAIAGVICMRVCVLPSKIEPPDMAT
jgi:hypothetical protein